MPPEGAAIEALEKLGLTVWLGGKPFGKIKNGNLVGGPKCGSCGSAFPLGVTLEGGQSICKKCLDSLRQMLFDLLHDKFPELLKVVLAEGIEPSSSG